MYFPTVVSGTNLKNKDKKNIFKNCVHLHFKYEHGDVEFMDEEYDYK